MKKLMIILALVVALLLPASVTSQPVEAVNNIPVAAVTWTPATSAGKTIQVTENLPASWDVKKALSFVDKYTGSKFKIVKKCSADAWRCVTIKQGSVKGGPSGTIGWAKNGTITVDVKDAKKSGKFNSATRTWLLVHEIGHTRGLGHRSSCATSMYEKRRCNGKVPPLKFDAAQKATLKKG